jgi:hypothetical protein
VQRIPRLSTTFILLFFWASTALAEPIYIPSQAKIALAMARKVYKYTNPRILGFGRSKTGGHRYYVEGENTPEDVVLVVVFDKEGNVLPVREATFSELQNR